MILFLKKVYEVTFLENAAFPFKVVFYPSSANAVIFSPDASVLMALSTLASFPDASTSLSLPEDVLCFLKSTLMPEVARN